MRKGFHLKREQRERGFSDMVYLYSGTYVLNAWCYKPFAKKFPNLKLKQGEKIPVNIKITRRLK